MDAFFVILGLVLWWYILKGVYSLALAAWEEVSPAVRVLWRVVAWLLYLPFAPFVALWEVIVGRPETDEEREQRLREEQEQRKAMSRERSDQERQEQLEAIRKALKID